MRPPGVTLDSLYTYLPTKGRPPKTTPKDSFKEAAAKVIPCDALWLKEGVGSPTKEHGAAVKMARVARPMPDFQGHRLRDAVYSALGAPLPKGDTFPAWVAPLGLVWLRFVDADIRGGNGVVNEKLEANIARAIAAPLKTLGIEPEGVMTDYILALIPALLALAAERARQLEAARESQEDAATSKGKGSKRTVKRSRKPSRG